MKYVCEICGRQFDRKTDCIKHEKACKEKHAALIKVADLINEAVKVAKGASISIVLNECNATEKTFITEAELEKDGKTVLVSFD